MKRFQVGTYRTFYGPEFCMLHDVKAGTLLARPRNDGDNQNVLLVYETIEDCIDEPESHSSR